MLDLSTHPTALYGALTALAVYGIFIGTWWYYGMRAHRANAMVENGSALLLDIDPSRNFARAHVDRARNIPLEELEERIHELGSTRRPIVLCGSGALRAHRAASTLRHAGYEVINLGSSLTEAARA